MSQPFVLNRITPEKALERLDVLLNNNVSKKESFYQLDGAIKAIKRKK